MDKWKSQKVFGNWFVTNQDGDCIAMCTTQSAADCIINALHASEAQPQADNTASDAILRRKDIEKIIDCVYHYCGFKDGKDPSDTIRDLFPDLYVAIMRT